MNSINIHNILLCLSTVFSMVVVDASPVDPETQLVEIIYNSYIANRNHLLANSIMESNHFKEQLSKRNMPDLIRDATFHVESENILMLYMNWYFIRIPRPTVIFYGNAFIEKELLEMKKNPYYKLPCERCVLANFIEFLQSEQNESNNVKQLIDFIRKSNNVSYRKELERALLDRLKLAELLEKKPIEEQNFYNDLFNDINEENQWFSKIIDDFIKWNNNLIIEIVGKMKVKVVVGASLVEQEAQVVDIISQSYLVNRNHLLAVRIMRNKNLKQLLSLYNMPDPDTDDAFHQQFENILVLYLNWYFIRVQLPPIIPYGDAFIKTELLKIEKPQRIQYQLDAFINFLQGEQKTHNNLKQLIDFLNKADNVNARKELDRALLDRLKLAELLEEKPIEEQNFAMFCSMLLMRKKNGF